MANNVAQQSNIAFKGISTYFFKDGSPDNYAYFDCSQLGTGGVSFTLPSSGGTLQTTASSGGELTIGAGGGTCVITLSTDTLTFTGTSGVSVTVSEDILTFGLSDTGVTAQSYGTATSFPVITVDKEGRITSASTNATQVAANFVTEGDEEAAFGTNNGQVRLYSTAQGVCIDTKSTYPIELKHDGTCIAAIAQSQPNVAALVFYKTRTTIRNDKGSSSVSQEMGLNAYGSGTSALSIDTINGSMHIEAGSGQAPGNGMSAVRIQGWKEIYGINGFTSGTTKKNIWTNDYLNQGGTSGSYLVKTTISGLSGDYSANAAVETSNLFLDKNDGNGFTDINNTTQTLYDSSGLVTAVELTSAGSSIHLNVTSAIADTIQWRGVAEIIYNRLGVF